jgi:hypothetical protein
LPVQLAATAATATGNSTEGYSHHALMNVNDPASNVSLGSSQCSTRQLYQPHTLGVHPVPQTTLEGRSVHTLGMPMSATEPRLPAQFTSWCLLSALSVACQEQHRRPFSLSTSHDRGLVSTSPAYHEDPPYAQPQRSTEAIQSNLPDRDESASHYLHLQQIKFDDFTDDTLGDVEETDTLSVCSCGSTMY